MEKNRAQVEEIISLNIEQESQAMMLCEITKQKKIAIEDTAMIEDDKRKLSNILEENSSGFCVLTFVTSFFYSLR